MYALSSKLATAVDTLFKSRYFPDSEDGDIDTSKQRTTFDVDWTRSTFIGSDEDKEQCEAAWGKTLETRPYIQGQMDASRIAKLLFDDILLLRFGPKSSYAGTSGLDKLSTESIQFLCLGAEGKPAAFSCIYLTAFPSVWCIVIMTNLCESSWEDVKLDILLSDEAKAALCDEDSPKKGTSFFAPLTVKSHTLSLDMDSIQMLNNPISLSALMACTLLEEEDISPHWKALITQLKLPEESPLANLLTEKTPPFDPAVAESLLKASSARMFTTK